MVAVVARHAEKSELFGAGERTHPTNERNKLENSVCGTSSDIQPVVRLSRPGKCASDRTACWTYRPTRPNNPDDLFEQAQSAEEAGDIAEAERASPRQHSRNSGNWGKADEADYSVHRCRRRNAGFVVKKR